MYRNYGCAFGAVFCMIMGMGIYGKSMGKAKFFVPQIYCSRRRPCRLKFIDFDHKKHGNIKNRVRLRRGVTLMYGMLLKLAGKAPEIAHESGLPNHYAVDKRQKQGRRLGLRPASAPVPP
jgi:hypothetical protein